MKHPNGYGSVYNMGKGRRRPYRVVITAGWIKGEDGEYKQKRVTLGYYKTRKEAMVALAEYNADPYDVNASKITFAEIYEKWIEKKKLTITGGTAGLYTSAYKRCTSLHNMNMADIKTDHMQSILDDMAGMSNTSKQYVITVCRNVYEYAVQHDIVQKDYSAYLKMHSTSTASDIHTAFTAEEIAMLWIHAEDEVLTNNKPVLHQRFIDTILIMIYTGMRPAELLAMKTEDVHLDEQYMTGGVKTESSKNRIIPIHNDIVPLVRWRYEQGGEYLIQNVRDNKPFTHMKYVNAMVNVLKPLGMEHLSHDGRHTFATFGKLSPVEDFYISKIMGHRLDRITERVYTHVTVSDLVREVNRITFKNGV